MPIRESLCSGDSISFLADVVVGSAFQVDAGRLAQSVVVVACTARISYRQSRSGPYGLLMNDSQK